VVLKPSELAPLSALLFAEMLDDAGCPPGVLNLVNGTGATVGGALASHPQVDMISITGSTRAGVLVAQAAAPTVKRVAQELGGKSPNIILPDADLRRAVPLGVGAAFRNLGQSCSAPTRMLVSRAQMAEVEVLAAAAASELVVGDPLGESTTHGPIANRPQFERVQAMIGVGLEEGAKLVIGGQGRPDELEIGLYARPTIFSNVRRDMRIAQEEIFGPVLSIIPYDTVEEAVEIANDTVYGLGHMCKALICRRCARSPGRSSRARSISTIPSGIPTHPLVDTSVPATGANTASRASRNISRPKPFSVTSDETHHL
jgi:aldehyde dehydrogenase (NAD+)